MTTESSLTSHDISKEAWREYVWKKDGIQHVYRIESPKTLVLKKYPDGRPGSTHRVIDFSDVVHIVPAIGQLGCVVRYMPENPEEPVQF